MTSVQISLHSNLCSGGEQMLALRILLLPFVISSRNSLHAALCCFSHQPGLSALPPVTAATPAPAIGIQPQVLSLLAAATCRWCARRVLLTTAIHTVACSSSVSAGGALYLHTSRRSVAGATGLTAARRSAVGAAPRDSVPRPARSGGVIHLSFMHR